MNSVKISPKELLDDDGESVVLENNIVEITSAEMWREMEKIVSLDLSKHLNYPKCKNCEVPLEDGIAWKEGYFHSPDFPGDDGSEIGCTVTLSGNSRLISVYKCPKCGYSITK